MYKDALTSQCHPVTVFTAATRTLDRVPRNHATLVTLTGRRPATTLPPAPATRCLETETVMQKLIVTTSSIPSAHMGMSVPRHPKGVGDSSSAGAVSALRPVHIKEVGQTPLFARCAKSRDFCAFP